ncbi:MAG: hypothetical protein M1838_002277 [Thelocarpon superellum]|nr:MAG: hypothetical protein M1838_002277 [Thelocarpon superellum]
MTLAGLNTINLSTLNTFQQFLLFLLIIMGSAASILVSAVVVFFRMNAFEAKFQEVKGERKKRRLKSPSWRSLSFSRSSSHTRPDLSGIPSGATPQSREDEAQGESAIEDDKDEMSGGSRNPAPSGATAENMLQDVDGSETQHIAFTPDTRFRASTASQQARPRLRLLSMQGVGASADALEKVASSRDSTLERPESLFHGASRPFLGPNSQFHHLTRAERDELGGAEYRAVSLLAVIVPLYFVLWLLLGSLGVGAWIAKYKAEVTRENGLNPWWVGAFNAISAFNNSGMSLLDANMIPFEDSFYVLITMGLLILAGNTCYPVFLRLILWTLRHLLHRWKYFSGYDQTLQFLLDHPRRCYTNLFPSAHTWWLLLAVVTLNGIDWVAFEILNIGNEALTSIPRGARVLDGLFQALAVRSGGFYVVPISSLRIGLQVLYVWMMYISVYPVVITMRSSNVYEERSLGLYADDLPHDPQGPETPRRKPSFFTTLRQRITGDPPPIANASYFVRQQLHAQLAHDIWWIVLAVLFITITETGQFEADPVDYSVFNVIFEVVSAYGCVGISVGLPNEAYSFCGGWHALSKLILCAVMLRGRHRGLPVAIDRAVLLPGEYLAAAEEEDAAIRMNHTRARTGMV